MLFFNFCVFLIFFDIFCFLEVWITIRVAAHALEQLPICDAIIVRKAGIVDRVITIKIVHLASPFVVFFFTLLYHFKEHVPMPFAR